MNTLEQLYQHYLLHPEVSTDSRKISEGCIFFALTGSNFDGNQYALDAIAQGASLAVVDDETLPEHPQLMLVDDVLLTLQELAALHRAKLSKPVIAITGTNGKTTTKELTAAVLSTSFSLLYTEGNLNNHIGVPLTLLRLRAEHDFALIEMGASKPGDIEELCQIAQPNYGLITNIGEAHLEGFRSIIGVERTKAELYVWLREHDGKIIRREEDERLARLGQGIPAVTYGQSTEAVIRGRALTEPNSLYLQFEWEAPAIQIAPQRQSTQLVGAYNLDNALAAIAIGLFFGVEPARIREALERYQPSNSRSQFVQTERNRLIVDAYNANPSSMQTALHNIFAHKGKDALVLILGDMNELGDSSRQAHAEIYALIQRERQRRTIQALFCGPIWMDYLAQTEELSFANAQQLAEYLQQNTITESLILVKGSNGIKLGTIIQYL
ncbi:MAG: UDP-N-acetylmuramoyl-tripeptide--D-alanyl-D-alanine ligase [Porphyromonas sp.]|nr:UDP-N-acetylmuramoyl-tripeptide--D-alanyl-D-alanine ligase [Porphyromonas sp.]